MPKISIVLTTARERYESLIGMEKTELFYPTLTSLERQFFRDFELIIVDALHHTRPNIFPKLRTYLKIKHVPFTFKESRWLQRGMWNNVQMRNKGITYADGELIVFAGDCCEFSPHAMELYWQWFKDGYMPQAVFRWSKAGTLTGKKDHRWIELDKRSEDFLLHSYPNWFFEYGSIPLNLLLKINGFDENFDGVKALEDVEIGMRLAQLGYDRYVLDKRLYVTEYLHHPLPIQMFFEDHDMRQGGLKWEAPASAKYTHAFKDAYAIMMFNEENHRWKANTEPLTDEDIEKIKKYSEQCFLDGTLTGNHYIWEKSRHFNYWKNNQPVFDLEQLRQQRIQSES